jgi:hypothetical protein
VYEEFQFLICKVKPAVVDVAVSKVGVRAAPVAKFDADILF